MGAIQSSVNQALSVGAILASQSEALKENVKKIKFERETQKNIENIFKQEESLRKSTEAAEKEDDKEKLNELSGMYVDVIGKIEKIGKSKYEKDPTEENLEDYLLGRKANKYAQEREKARLEAEAALKNRREELGDKYYIGGQEITDPGLIERIKQAEQKGGM